MKPVKVVRKYRGRFLSTYEVHYETDGEEYTHEMVSRKGSLHDPDPLDTLTIGEGITGVICLVFNKTHNSICLIQEYRPAANAWVCEIPMGCKKQDETIEEAALRETTEETGLTDLTIIKTLKPVFTNPSITDAKTVTVILEADGEPTYQSHNNEHIMPLWLPIEKVKQLLNHEHCPPMGSTTQSLLYAVISDPLFYTNC